MNKYLSFQVFKTFLECLCSSGLEGALLKFVVGDIT